MGNSKGLGDISFTFRKTLSSVPWKIALSSANMDMSKDISKEILVISRQWLLVGPDWVGGGEGVDTMPSGKY